MKKRKLQKKLAFSKSTVANLGAAEQKVVRGGYVQTDFDANCYTWDPYTNCATKPDYLCRSRYSDCETSPCTHHTEKPCFTIMIPGEA